MLEVKEGRGIESFLQDFVQAVLVFVFFGSWGESIKVVISQGFYSQSFSFQDIIFRRLLWLNRWVLSCIWFCIKRFEFYLLVLFDIDLFSNFELVLGCLWFFQFFYLYRKDRLESLWVFLGVREFYVVLVFIFSLIVVFWVIGLCLFSCQIYF